MERKRALPESIAKDVEEATSSLLLKKSRDAYYKELNYFNTWKQENVSGVSEACCWVSSMWTKYSMLRATLKLHENADISQYGRLIAFFEERI